MVGGLFTLLWGEIWIGKRDGTPRLLVSSVPAQEVKTNYAADSEIYSSGGVGAVGCVVSGAMGEWGG